MMKSDEAQAIKLSLWQWQQTVPAFRGLYLTGIIWRIQAKHRQKPELILDISVAAPNIKAVEISLFKSALPKRQTGQLLLCLR